MNKIFLNGQPPDTIDNHALIIDNCFKEITDDEIGEKGYSGGNGGVPPMDERIGRLEGKVDRLDARLGGLETSVARLEVQMDGVERGLGKLEQSVDGLKTEIGSFKKWFAATLIALSGLIIATLTLHTTWIYNDTNKNWQMSEELMKKIDANQQRLEHLDNRPYPHP